LSNSRGSLNYHRERGQGDPEQAAHLLDAAERISGLAGLQSKIWISDDARSVASGIYLFDTDDHARAWGDEIFGKDAKPTIRNSVGHTEDIAPDMPDHRDMARPTHRHHQGHAPPYAGFNTGRRRVPKAGTLVIHRPGQPDEVISASEFRRRVRPSEPPDADRTHIGSRQRERCK